MQPNRLSAASESYLNELRDVADRDYILARIAFRHDFDDQFLWLAQQAVEKYLKILLVYHGQSARKLGHALTSALQRLQKVRDVPFGFPGALGGFLSYLDRHANRYAETLRPVSTE